jgi:hypothetical protein
LSKRKDSSGTKAVSDELIFNIESYCLYVYHLTTASTSTKTTATKTIGTTTTITTTTRSSHIDWYNYHITLYQNHIIMNLISNNPELLFPSVRNILTHVCLKEPKLRLFLCTWGVFNKDKNIVFNYI